MVPQSRFALTPLKVCVFLLFRLSLSAFPASAQVQLGTPKYESFGGGPFDTVNLGNLNVNFTIPVLHKPGRGMPFNFDITYDSTFWQPTSVNGQLQWIPTPTSGLGGSALNIGALLYSYGYFLACTTGHIIPA
jgi:hypothetical protein